jgi:dTDP-glucose 4,6-dehydratase
MQNMLVTGGCGFIGANFIRYLLTESDFKGRIVNVDKLTYAGNPENLADIEIDFENRYAFIKADICDGIRMHEIFDDYEIDSVCHFAAESHVDRSIVQPDTFIQTNIVGTFNLLEAARSRQSQIIRFHHISTDEVYGRLFYGNNALQAQQPVFGFQGLFRSSVAGLLQDLWPAHDYLKLLE